MKSTLKSVDAVRRNLIRKPGISEQNPEIMAQEEQKKRRATHELSGFILTVQQSTHLFPIRVIILKFLNEHINTFHILAIDIPELVNNFVVKLWYGRGNSSPPFINLAVLAQDQYIKSDICLRAVNYEKVGLSPTKLPRRP